MTVIDRAHLLERALRAVLDTRDAEGRAHLAATADPRNLQKHADWTAATRAAALAEVAAYNLLGRA